MRHSEGASYLGLADYIVRTNDDGRGWTAHGNHPVLGRVVLGVRVEQFRLRRQSFGNRHGYGYTKFIAIEGRQEKTYLSERKKPSFEQVYDTAASAIGNAVHFQMTARDHQAADAKCGREWTCQCGACRIVREDRARQGFQRRLVDSYLAEG